MAVSTRRSGEVFEISINNPPVNALSQHVRAGLQNAIAEFNRDDGAKVAIICGENKKFSGGADITEFGKPALAPHLGDVLGDIAASAKPVIAFIDGFALGGGLELALACQYRIASKQALAGLPEVKLGLIPGAGGTQRLPRLIGVERAAQMICFAENVSAEIGEEFGLFDCVIDGDDESALRDFALMVSNRTAPGRAGQLEQLRYDEAWREAFEQKLYKKWRGQTSPHKALQAICKGAALSLTDAIALEREIFRTCMRSPQRRALIHAFFAERAAKKHKFLENANARKIETIGIIGAGTMGAGIAISCARAGFNVLLSDSNKDALDAAFGRIEKTFERQAQKENGASMRQLGFSRITPAASLSEMSGAELFIEAVIEDMDVKKTVFCALDKIAQDGAIIASNTSYLDINELAGATNRPRDVLGMHFFSPANIMRLLEIVRSDAASDETLATAMAVGWKMKKLCVLAGVCDGFIGNRIFKRYRQQADYLVEDGAMPQDVDRVMREFGFAMGPFEVSDLAGLDIGWRNRRREDTFRDRAERYCAIADKLYELGRFGQKTQAGWYAYPQGARTPQVDPEVEAIIIEESKSKGIKRRAILDDEIKERILYAMINEGAKVLADGVAARASDIDLVFLNGYGFPAYRGGPMFAADEIGLDRILKRMRNFASPDEYSWRECDLLVQYAKEEKRISDYVAARDHNGA